MSRRIAASWHVCRYRYAKKSLKKPVVPLVVGRGGWEWQMTVVGMLLAGELYICFQSDELLEAKV